MTFRFFLRKKAALLSQTDATCCLPSAYLISGCAHPGNAHMPHRILPSSVVNSEIEIIPTCIPSAHALSVSWEA
jgi:hypothetical protein